MRLFHEGGSSPLTRGKLARRVGDAIHARLIPAHAGKTTPRARRPASHEAHPRSRGENSVLRMPDGTPPGSSPLTRGKRGVHDGQYSEARLIPAHAGKTPWVTRTVVQPTAHPRSRGENKLGRVSVGVQSGSSPLTRGKRFAGAGAATGAGLIPAHAGKTWSSPRALSKPSAHPRSRGENPS